MVYIAKDFNNDMQQYLDKIYGKKGRELSKKKQKKAPVETVPEISEEEVYVEYDEPRSFGSWVSSIFGIKRTPLEDEDEEVLNEVEEELEVVDQEVQELEEKREGLLKRLFGFMRRRNYADLEDEEKGGDDVLQLDPDVKEVLKKLHLWLEKLPNHELRAFRLSEDFDQYKTLLEKYGLIKK